MSVPWKPTNAMREVEIRTDYIERTMAEHRPIDNGTLAHLMQAVEDYKARVAELEAITAKLPRTADGVPVVPGDELFQVNNRGRVETVVANVIDGESIIYGISSFIMMSDCYATPKAARQSATAGEREARDE